MCHSRRDYQPLFGNEPAFLLKTEHERAAEIEPMSSSLLHCATLLNIHVQSCNLRLTLARMYYKNVGFSLMLELDY